MEMVSFLVINCPSAYNAILGRTSLNKMKAIPSTYHLKMKFPMEAGVGEVRGDQHFARWCYLTSLKDPQSRTTMTLNTVEMWNEHKLQQGQNQKRHSPKFRLTTTHTTEYKLGSTWRENVGKSSFKFSKNTRMSAHGLTATCQASAPR